MLNYTTRFPSKSKLTNDLNSELNLLCDKFSTNYPSLQVGKCPRSTKKKFIDDINNTFESLYTIADLAYPQIQGNRISKGKLVEDINYHLNVLNNIDLGCFRVNYENDGIKVYKAKKEADESYPDNWYKPNCWDILPRYSIIEDVDYPYTKNEDGIFVSGNIGRKNSTSTFTLTAKNSIIVTLEYKASTENKYDKLSIRKDTTILASEIWGVTDYIPLEVYLDGGESLTITYTKSNTTVFVDVYENDDCVYIKNLKIRAVAEPSVPMYTVINDENYPYTKNEDNILVSGNKGRGSSTSSYIIIAENSTKVSFDYKVSSEKNYDKLTIKKDEEILVNGISGITEYESLYINLNSGEILTISYSKDGSTNKNDDCVYIKNLKFEPVYKTMGDVKITNDSKYPWTTLGDGVMTSGNKGVYHSTSTYKITANEDVEIGFDYRVSSSSAHTLTIKKGNTALVNGIYGKTEYKSLIVSLAVGESLTIVYDKNNGSSGAYDDCAYIKNLKIKSLAPKESLWVDVESGEYIESGNIIKIEYSQHKIIENDRVSKFNACGFETITSSDRIIIGKVIGTTSLAYVEETDKYATITIKDIKDDSITQTCEVLKGNTLDILKIPDKRGFITDYLVNDEVVEIQSYIIKEDVVIYPIYTWIWDGVYKGGDNYYSSNNIIVTVLNGIPVSMTQDGTSISITEVSSNTWGNAKGVAYKGSNYSYSHYRLTLKESTSYNYISCYCKASNSSDYNANTASSSHSVYLYKYK